MSLVIVMEVKSIQFRLGNRMATVFGKGCQLCLTSVLFCGCLIEFVCLGVDLIVSITEFTYLLLTKCASLQIYR